MSSSSQYPAWYSGPPTMDPESSSINDDMNYNQRLKRHIQQYTKHDAPVFLQYRSLHLLNVTYLQNKLARLKSSCYSSDLALEDDVNEIGTTLHKYVNAIRDYAYMLSLADAEREEAERYHYQLSQAFFDIAELPGTPFNSRHCSFPRPASLESDPLRSYLKRALPRRLAYSRDEAYRRADAYLNGRPPLTVSPFVDSLARFLIAFGGGIVLILPMLVMLLPAVDRTKSLVTTCVAVVVFAVSISIVVKAGNVETLVATTTYAAVLVVFVGLNTSS